MKITKEVTPKELLCMIGGCPAIFRTDKKSYVLIGKKLNKVDSKKIADRIAKDEFAVEIPIRLIDKRGE